MKSLPITIIIVMCIFILNETLAQTSEYIPVGSSETEKLEKGLYELLPVYVCGIYPKTEKIMMGVSPNDIPPKYVEKIKTWINKVLKTELQPEQSKNSNWVGIRKLHWDQNYIVGRYPSNEIKDDDIYKDTSIEVQADDRSISLTILSDSLFPQDANDISDVQILESFTKFLKIPENKINKIDVERHFCTISGINVCYGKIRCEWNEKKSNENKRDWLSYIPFWYMKGKTFVNISTVDWTKGERPAFAKNAWDF